MNEEKFARNVKQYLEEHNWEVLTEVPRADCINWKNPYRADLLIRHPFWKDLNWIGLELKIFNGTKSMCHAFEQIISKYQGNYFDGIDEPVWAWAVVVNTVPQQDQRFPADTFYREMVRGARLIMTRFGVGFLAFDKLNPWLGKWYNSRYNRIDFVDGNPRYSICLEEEAMNNYSKPDIVKKFIATRTSWRKHLNPNNIGKGWGCKSNGI